MKKVRAHRFEFTNHLKERASNNVLEFLSEIVSIWIGTIEKEAKPIVYVFTVLTALQKLVGLIQKMSAMKNDHTSISAVN